MTIQTINLGAYANDGTGDDLRTAFQKVNANFTQLASANNIANGTNLGTGVGIFAQRNVLNLEFKSLTSTNNSVQITSTANTVNLAASTDLISDTSPQLGGNLDLNGFYVTNGDLQAPVFGYNVPLIANLLELLLLSNQFTVDLGEFINPAGGSGSPVDLDFGAFIYPTYPNNNIDFGTF